MAGQHWLSVRRNRVIVLLAAMAAALLLMARVRGILSPFILAGVITYILEPPVCSLERHGLPRTWSIILIYLLVIGGAALLVAWIIPSALAELYGLTQTLPSYTKQLQELGLGLQRFYARLALPESVRLMLDQSLVNAEGGLLKVIGATITGILGAIAWIPGLVLAPFLAFYALKDLQTIRSGFINSLPRESRTEVGGLLSAIDSVLARFLRGQVILSAVVGAVFAFGLRVLGLPFWVIIGVFAAFAEVIPYFGPVIGAAPAVAIALTRSPALAVKVIILFAVIQELENVVLAPKIMGDSIGLHPLWVFFAILAGGELAGFWGLLLAVPTAGIMKVILTYGAGKMAATATPKAGEPEADGVDSSCKKEDERR
ncbi:MAG TPA: AI-2E family transporter [Bacillota bacterium]|jgi:predicted PurR-regulated permease PerM